MASQLSRIDIPRLGIEALIIIASILLALAVDEWREDRRDRQLEREYLVRLVEDLDANVTVLNLQKRRETQRIGNARAVYPLVNTGDWVDLDPITATVASYNASPSGTPNWINDTFEELKSTGRLSLIESPEIRRELLAYYRYLDEQDWSYQLMSTEYRDAIREALDPDIQLLVRQECPFREVGCRVAIDPSDVAEYLAWLSDNPTLANGLRRVIVQWTRGQREYLPYVEDRTAKLRRIIEQVLQH